MAEQTNKVKVNQDDYELSHAQTDAVQIVDPGVGKEAILRHWFFKSNPMPPGMKKPSKLEVISYFKRLIEMSLWGDGLVIREDRPLEMHTKKSVKRISTAIYQKMQDEGADFVIMALASPRHGVSVLDKPLKAQ